MMRRCVLLRPSRLSQALCLSLCIVGGHAAAQDTQANAPAPHFAPAPAGPRSL